jgi:hypothetical protein
MVFTPLIIQKHNRMSNFKKGSNLLVTNFVKFVLSTFKISLLGISDLYIKAQCNIILL